MSLKLRDSNVKSKGAMVGGSDANDSSGENTHGGGRWSSSPHRHHSFYLLHIIQKNVSFFFVHPPNKTNTTATSVIHQTYILIDLCFSLCRGEGEGWIAHAHSMERTTNPAKTSSCMVYVGINIIIYNYLPLRCDVQKFKS